MPSIRQWWTIPQTGREKDKGYKLARAVRDQLGLGDEPIEDLQLLCERDSRPVGGVEPLPDNIRGVLVRIGETLPELNAGEHVESPTQGFALVNTSGMTPASQRFTMAHELAHYLFNDSDDGLLRVETESTGIDGLMRLLRGAPRAGGCDPSGWTRLVKTRALNLMSGWQSLSQLGSA